VPASLPGIAVDEQKVVTSTGALKFKEVPKRLLVIGGGIIGLELGSVWGRLGSKITVVEFLPAILPGLDSEAARQTQRNLQKQGMEFRLSTKVTGIEKRGDGVLSTCGSSRRRAASLSSSRPMRCWWRWVASRSRTGSGWRMPAWRSTSAAASAPIISSRPTCRASTPSAT
jgi:hypothetical protein